MPLNYNFKVVNVVLYEFHLNFLKINFTKGSTLGTVLGILNPYRDMGPVYENHKF